MDKYEILSMFGQGTFGRLYQAVLRSSLRDDELPAWVAQQPAKRAERRRQEEEANRAAGERAAEEAGGVGSGPSEPVMSSGAESSTHSSSAASSNASSSTAAPSSSSSASDASIISSLRRAPLVIKEVPFSGLPPQEQQDILNEVRVMSAVNHSAFIAYYESFLDNGCLYIVMELAQGGDLAQLLNAAKPTCLSESELWRYLLQLLEGLSYLHSRRILHRDIKPANIFLDSRHNIKIGDLGLGRILGSKSVVARTGVGTPLYFSPELCQDQPYDEKSDVWSLGCLLYEMATFQPPFLASNQIALAHKIVHDAPCPLPSSYSSELRFLVSKMLEKDASRRPSVDAMLQYSPVKLRRHESALLTRVADLTGRLQQQQAATQHARGQQERAEREVAAVKQQMQAEQSKAQQQLAHAQTQYEQVCELLRAAESAVERLYSSEASSASASATQQQLLEQYALHAARAQQEQEQLRSRLRSQESTMLAQAATVQQLTGQLETLRTQMQQQQQHQQPASQPLQPQPSRQQPSLTSPAPLPPLAPSTHRARSSEQADVSRVQHPSPLPSPMPTPSIPAASLSGAPSITVHLPLPAMTAAATATATATAGTASAVTPQPAAVSAPAPSSSAHALSSVGAAKSSSSPHSSPSLARYAKVSRTPYLGPPLRVPVAHHSSPSKHAAAGSSLMLTPRQAASASATVTVAAASAGITAVDPRRVLDWSDAEQPASTGADHDDDECMPTLTHTPHAKPARTPATATSRTPRAAASQTHAIPQRSPAWHPSDACHALNRSLAAELEHLSGASDDDAELTRVQDESFHSDMGRFATSSSLRSLVSTPVLNSHGHSPLQLPASPHSHAAGAWQQQQQSLHSVSTKTHAWPLSSQQLDQLLSMSSEADAWEGQQA